MEALVSELKVLGLAGLEAFYPGHDAATTETLRLLAGRLALVTTGGTDFHGWRPGMIELGGSPTEFHVTTGMTNEFLELCDEIIGETEAV